MNGEEKANKELLAELEGCREKPKNSKGNQADDREKKLLERLNLASRAARLGIWDWDIQKNELTWDDRMYELYGIRKENFSGAYEAWLAGIHPDDRTRSDEISEQARRGEKEYDTEFRVIWPDGSVHVLKAYGEIVRDSNGNPVRMTGINYDITEQKKIEFDRYIKKRAIESSINAKLIAGIDWCLTYVNKAFLDLWGYSGRDEVLNRPVGDFWENPSEASGVIGKLMIEGHILSEMTARRKNGSIFIAHFSANLVKDEAGNVICILGSFIDITEQREAEEALQESEKYYRGLFENMTEGFAYCRMIFEEGRPVDWIYLIVNDSFESQTGLKSIQAKRATEAIPGIRESDLELFEIYSRVSLTGKSEKFERYVNSLNMWFSVSVYSPKKEYFVAVFDVITERKIKEEREKYWLFSPIES